MKSYEQWIKEPIADCKPEKKKPSKKAKGGTVSTFSGSNGPPPTHD